jgi:hypothetical protein
MKYKKEIGSTEGNAAEAEAFSSNDEEEVKQGRKLKHKLHVLSKYVLLSKKLSSETITCFVDMKGQCNLMGNGSPR